jgi:hypothetical protein
MEGSAIQITPVSGDTVFSVAYKFDSVALVRRAGLVVGYMFHVTSYSHHGQFLPTDTVLFAQQRENLRFTGSGGTVYLDHEHGGLGSDERLVLMDDYGFPRVLLRSVEVRGLFDWRKKPRFEDVVLEWVLPPVESPSKTEA